MSADTLAAPHTLESYIEELIDVAASGRTDFVEKHAADIRAIVNGTQHCPHRTFHAEGCPPETRCIVVFRDELAVHEGHDLTVSLDIDVYCLTCEKVIGSDVR